MDDSSGRGTGNGSSLAAIPRAVRSPKEQPRLPFRSCSRDLFPLTRDPHRALPLVGSTHLVDDTLSTLNWLSGKREPAPFARKSDARRLCGAGGYPGEFDAGSNVTTVGVPTSAEPLSKVLRGLDAYDSGAGSSTLASLSCPKLSLPVDATGACCLLSMLPDSAGRYLR